MKDENFKDIKIIDARVKNQIIIKWRRIEIDTYLTISKNKFGIYLFDKKMNTLYKEEILRNVNDLELKNLSNFLMKIFLKLKNYWKFHK